MHAKILFFTLLLSFPFFSKAQHSLYESPKTSAYVYYYPVSAAGAAKLYKTSMNSFRESLLEQAADSVLIHSSRKPSLKPGNYIRMFVEENTMHAELISVGKAQVSILNNQRDLLIAVYDSSGKIIQDASVKIGKKKVGFDSQMQLYRKAGYSKSGMVLVKCGDAVFALESMVAKPYGNARFFRKIWKYLSFSWLKKNRSKHYYSYNEPNPIYKGFVLTSKPIYRPGDTVRLKGFITDKKGRGLSQPLLLRLSVNNGYYSSDYIDTILQVIHPYRDGGYTAEFVLNDSLDLDLDEDYCITLETEKSRRYDPRNYIGDLDEDELVKKRTVVGKTNFRYEAYELKGIDFLVRSNETHFTKGQPFSLYFSAKDENDLSVPDGRVKVNIVKSEGLENSVFFCEKVFVPDTLWQHELKLDPVGETKLLVPDSIFPAANIKLRVDAEFLNSNNESHSDNVYVDYSPDSVRIDFTPQEDSLSLRFLIAGKSQSQAGSIIALHLKDTLSVKSIQLPTVIATDPNADHYVLICGDRIKEYALSRNKKRVFFEGSRTTDSVTLQMVNPGKLPVWYSIFAGTRLINRGYASSLIFKEKIRTPKNYFVSWQYVYGGEAHTDEIGVADISKMLRVNVNQPSSVYPGQPVDVSVEVKDMKGNPVKDADVTALAYTSKFKSEVDARVPFLGKIWPGRKKKISAQQTNLQAPVASCPYTWDRWKTTIGLDTIEYFKFLHPSDIYQYDQPTTDTITQFAPFVVQNGDLLPVHQIYLDERPIYFDQSEQYTRYSFESTPGRHHLVLRTNNKLIQCDSIHLKKGMKNIISFLADTSNKRISITVMPDTLTRYEQEFWSRYMIRVQNEFGYNMALIGQGFRFYWLNPELDEEGSPKLIGPLMNDEAFFEKKNDFSHGFLAEPGYEYLFEPSRIKQKQTDASSLFNKHIYQQQPQQPLKDSVLTFEEADRIWNRSLDNHAATDPIFSNGYENEKNGKLRIDIKDSLFKSLPLIRSILFFRYDNPDVLNIYSGATRYYHVNSGKYRVMYLFSQSDYAILDSITVRPNGFNYFEIGKLKIRKADSTSIPIWQLICDKITGKEQNGESGKAKIKEQFNERFLNTAIFNQSFQSRVVDEKGNPIPFVSILIKGTRQGTSTNMDGVFHLQGADNSILVFTSIGYEKIEMPVNKLPVLIVLTKASNELQEVVVNSMATIRKNKEMAYSTVTISGNNLSNELTGKISGLNVESGAVFQWGFAEKTELVKLRGYGTYYNAMKPIMIIDGVNADGTYDLPELDSIVSMTVLKDAAATALYGSRAANGVIIITTKKGIGDNNGLSDGSFNSNTLRKNFRDDAYFMPKLKTDENGKLSFKVTYPDDITSWKSHVLVMGSQKKTGQADYTIRSYKPLSTSLGLPNFAIAGDLIKGIGKSLNYDIDTAMVKRNIFLNDKLVQTSDIRFRNIYIDTISIQSSSVDSIKTKYTIERKDGYFDGEERSIPVFKKGTAETSGLFTVFTHPDTMMVKLGSNQGEVHLYAASSLLPVMMDEAEQVRNYEYLCNEQLASKLKALLIQKKICDLNKTTFKHEEQILEIIGMLKKNKMGSGLWGWWNRSEPQAWISLHVIGALLQAAENGYEIELDKNLVKQYLLFEYPRQSATHKITYLQMLLKVSAKMDYKNEIDSLEKPTVKFNLYDRLRLVELKQQLGLPVLLDTFISKRKKTMMGNVYWGESENEFFDNTIQNSLLMYRVLRNQLAADDTLVQKLRAYFLETRKSGSWRNTYESSLIMETLLPDILAMNEKYGATSIQLSGAINLTITQFPYETRLQQFDSLQIIKTGGSPVYFTAYRKYWNEQPVKTDGGFSVNSYFEKSGQKTDSLKGGEAVWLKAEVEVKADASYVMVEIPIPAGCSYQEKSQSYANNEVHREHFKNKVSLFCSELKKGKYTFSISLMPRYSGEYTLNPAKAEMMYFPVFFGREKLKTVSVK